MSATSVVVMDARTGETSAVRPDPGDFKIEYGFGATPLGDCLLGLSGARVCYLGFVAKENTGEILEDLSRRWPEATLLANGERSGDWLFELLDRPTRRDLGLPLLLKGTTFQLEVWKALIGLPAGKVSSYSEIAERVGRPKAARAVGLAIGANPIAWLIPCHRVCRRDGGLGGYRWGPTAKRACLEFERRKFAAARADALSCSKRSKR